MVLAYILILAKVYQARNPFILPPKKVPHEFQFESFYLRLYTKGGVTEDDIEQNGVAVAEGASRHIPEFVKEYESMLAQKRMVSNEVRSISYQLHTLMLDDEVRRVPILSSWLVKQPPRNTLIIQKSQRGTRTLSPFPLLAHLNDATLAWSRPALRQTCGASESLEDIPSQQTTQSGFFSTHLRNTSSHLQISLLNCKCQRICSPLWS